jgi:hypothetical protein
VNTPSGICLPSEMIQLSIRQILCYYLCQPCANKPLGNSNDADLARIESFLWPRWKTLASHVLKHSPQDRRHIIEQLLTLDFKMPSQTRIDLKELLNLTMIADGQFYKTRLALYFALNFHRIAGNVMHLDSNRQLSVCFVGVILVGYWIWGEVDV